MWKTPKKKIKEKTFEIAIENPMAMHMDFLFPISYMDSLWISNVFFFLGYRHLHGVFAAGADELQVRRVDGELVPKPRI